MKEPCDGSPARRLILAELKARLACLDGPDTICMDDDGEALCSSATKAGEREALRVRIAHLESKN